MLLKSGGISGYMRASSLYGRAAHETSLLHGASLARAIYNAIQTVVATVLAAAAPLLLLAVAAVRRELRANDRVAWSLIAAWVLPYFALYAFVHFGKPGYALAYLPAFAVAAAGATCNSSFAETAAALLAAFAIAFFLVVPVRRLPPLLTLFRAPSFVPTAASIRVQDREADYLSLMANQCRAPSCSIVSLGTAREFWEHDPWSLRRWYAPRLEVKRLTDRGRKAPQGSTVYWIGGNVPEAVARYARHLQSVGLWQSYETRGQRTRELEKAVGLVPPPGSAASHGVLTHR
jgi:hypothetical protein